MVSASCIILKTAGSSFGIRARSTGWPRWAQISTASWSAAIMPSPSRSTLRSPMSSMSLLSHCRTERPGIRAFSSGTNRSRPSVLSTIPPECCPRWRGRPRTLPQVSMSARSLGCASATPAMRSCSPSSRVWGRSPPW